MATPACADQIERERRRRRSRMSSGVDSMTRKWSPQAGATGKLKRIGWMSERGTSVEEIFRRAEKPRNEGSRAPADLAGGVAVEGLFSSYKNRNLCRAIFEDFSLSRSLLPKLYRALGRSQVTIGSWDCHKGACHREVMYMAPGSKRTKGPYMSYDTQTLTSPADGVCVLDSKVRTPTVPYGDKFATAVRYIVAADSVDANNSQLRVSFDTLWLNKRPLVAPAIKRAVAKQMRLNFGLVHDHFPPAAT